MVLCSGPRVLAAVSDNKPNHCSDWAQVQRPLAGPMLPAVLLWSAAVGDAAELRIRDTNHGLRVS